MGGYIKKYINKYGLSDNINNFFFLFPILLFVISNISPIEMHMPVSINRQVEEVVVITQKGETFRIDIYLIEKIYR